ncbi:MAG: hypothetical protein QXG91_00395 [Candidatus Aenigmatarchaeota archaeon]
MNKEKIIGLIAIIALYFIILFFYLKDVEKIELNANEISSLVKRFKIYNTNGSLPYVKNGRIIMECTNTSNSYQGIISLTSVKARDELILEAIFHADIKKVSNNPKNEFAIFVSDDIENWDKDEFGIVIRFVNNTALKYYIQSPLLSKFFIETEIGKIEKMNNIVLKYSNNRIKVLLNNKLVGETDFVDIKGKRFYLVVSLKNLDGSDLSENFFEIEKVGVMNIEFFKILFLILILILISLFYFTFDKIQKKILENKLKALEREKAKLENAFLRREISKDLLEKEVSKISIEIRKIKEKLGKY